MKSIKTILLLKILSLISFFGCGFTKNNIQPHSSQHIDTLEWKVYRQILYHPDTSKIFYGNGLDSISVIKVKGILTELISSNKELNISYGFEYYKNGRLKRNYSFGFSGLYNDMYYYNDEFVSLKIMHTYVNGVLHGPTIFYYAQEYYFETPKIKEKNLYSYGKLHGESFTYRKNGSIEYKIIYDEGKQIVTYFYNKKGIIYATLKPIPSKE